MLRCFALLVGLLYACTELTAARQQVAGSQTAFSTELQTSVFYLTFQPIATRVNEAFAAEDYDLIIAESKKAVELLQATAYRHGEPKWYLDYLLYFKTALISSYLKKDDLQSLAQAKEMTQELLPVFASPSAAEFTERRVEFKQCALVVARNAELTDTTSTKSILHQLMALPADPADAQHQGYAVDAHLQSFLAYLISAEGKDADARQQAETHAKHAINSLNSLPSTSWSPSAWSAYVNANSVLSIAQYTQNNIEVAIDSLDQALNLVNAHPDPTEKLIYSAELQLEKTATLLEIGKLSQVNELLVHVAASLKDPIAAVEDYTWELQFLGDYQTAKLLYFQGNTAEEKKLRERLRLQIPGLGPAFDSLPWNTRLFYFDERYCQALDAAATDQKAEAAEELESLKQDFRKRMIPVSLRENADSQRFLMSCALLQYEVTGGEKLKAELDDYYKWCSARPEDIYASSMRAEYLLLVKHDATGITEYKEAGFPETVYSLDAWLHAIRAANTPVLQETKQQIVEKMKKLGLSDAYIDAVK